LNIGRTHHKYFWGDQQYLSVLLVNRYNIFIIFMMKPRRSLEGYFPKGADIESEKSKFNRTLQNLSREMNELMPKKISKRTSTFSVRPKWLKSNRKSKVLNKNAELNDNDNGDMLNLNKYTTDNKMNIEPDEMQTKNPEDYINFSRHKNSNVISEGNMYQMQQLGGYQGFRGYSLVDFVRKVLYGDNFPAFQPNSGKSYDQNSRSQSINSYDDEGSYEGLQYRSAIKLLRRGNQLRNKKIVPEVLARKKSILSRSTQYDSDGKYNQADKNIRNSDDGDKNSLSPNFILTTKSIDNSSVASGHFSNPGSVNTSANLSEMLRAELASMTPLSPKPIIRNNVGRQQQRLMYLSSNKGPNSKHKIVQISNIKIRSNSALSTRPRSRMMSANMNS